MLSELLLLAAIAAIIYYVYQLGTKNENFFLERGLKFKKPTFLVGNYLSIFLKKTSMFEYVKYINKDFPNEKLIGHFDFRNPIVVILDPEIAKQVAVKDFEHFVDHQELFNEETDPDFGNSLFALKGQKWKDMRSTLSPAFTGSKMRLMCDLIVEICEQMVDFLKTEAAEKGPQNHDAKKLLARLTMDVIGTCAFGIKVNSLKDKENEFFVTASKMANFRSALIQIKFVLFRMCPKVMEFFKISLFDERIKKYLRNLVLNTMKIREQQKITRPDMIHLLMEAQKGNLTHNANEKDSAGFATVEESNIGLSSTRRNWTDTEVVAQCFIFFVAGFEGVSNVATFMLYEIMVNPDIQQKLYDEISEANKNLNGKPLTYETLQQLKYVDMVMSEFLRKWTGPFLDRICTRDFTLKYDGGKEYSFKKGDTIWIPSVSYHYNPELFPNPEQLIPERFNDENKHSINTSAYAPFGIGPRNCVGSRFALMELKSILYYIVLNFHVEATKETQIPMKIAKSFIGPLPEKGMQLQFRPRK